MSQNDGIEAEVIDLLTLAPLDDPLFVQSAKKTARVLIVHEAPRSYGRGAELVARLVEKACYFLEAPVRCVTGFDLIMPLFAPEKAYLLSHGGLPKPDRRLGLE